MNDKKKLLRKGKRMNWKKRWIGLLMLFLFFVSLYQKPVMAQEDVPEIQDVNLQMIGGQIRVIEPMGLRVIGCIKKSYIAELEQSGASVSYGIVLLPKKYLGDEELEIGGKYLHNGIVYKSAKVPALKKFKEDEDRVYFTAVLTNMAEQRYQDDYASRAYVEITREIEQEDGTTENKVETIYSEDTIHRQVYEIAKTAVEGTIETEENKQWLIDNILNPVEEPQEPDQDDKSIKFQMGKVKGVTLYRKIDNTSDSSVEEVSHFAVQGFKKEDYLVKVEVEGQPEIFSTIDQVITSENQKISFRLKLDDYVTNVNGTQQEGAIVEFGTVKDGEATTQYITMQELIEKMKADPAGTYTLHHDIDASMVKADDELVTTFTGTLNGNGHKITGLTTTLFGTLSGGKVENLILENISITKTGGQDNTGGGTIADKAEKNAVIENVHVSGTLKSPASRQLLGGIVGRMDIAKVSKCSVNLQISGTFNTTGGIAGQFSNVEGGKNVIENCYTVGSIRGNKTNGAIGGLVGWHNNFKGFIIKNCYTAMELDVNVTGGHSSQAGGMIGYMGNSDDTGIMQNNVSFSTGTKGYKFDGGSEAQKIQKSGYKNNYTLKESDLNTDSTRLGETAVNGRITETPVKELCKQEFYINMGWDSQIWDFSPLANGKTPILKNGVQNESATLPVPEGQTEVPEISEDMTQQEIAPEETIASVAQRSTEEKAAYDSMEHIEGYQVERKQLYENLKLFMPFYTPKQIVLDGNKVDSNHVLNKKQVLSVYPMDERGNRVIAASTKTVQDIKKIRIQFTDKTTALIYNISYIDTRSNIASYNVSQIPVHFNFGKYIVDTTTSQFQKLLTEGVGYTFDEDIKTQVSAQDHDSVLNVYRTNFDNVVKKEMEQVLISFTAGNTQYPININNPIAEAMVTDTFITKEYLKDFLYAYNYVDRWYDFQIGGINLRDVVIFDNSILYTGKSPRSLATEIVQLSSVDGRKGNSTPSFYQNRISAYTGIDNVASFVEYFMSAYAGYEDVNDWIIDNFQGGFIVEARANNPKINSRLWRILKNNTVQRNNELILPVLSYKTSKNLYLASFPTALVYGNLQIYSDYQDTDEWRVKKKAVVDNQLNQYKNIYDNFVEVAANGADSVNKSKFLIVDSSYNKNHNQDVFKEFYRPLQTLWSNRSGAVAIVFGNPNYDYIYYNSSNFIGDMTVLNHEMGHVTDMWIWMENKGKRPGRNGEDYSNGYANQANVDYNMNFMREYPRDSDKLTNLTPDRINTQEEFQSYYKEVFDVIYTLDYLQGLAYLQLTPEQQAKITSQHRYGFMNKYQEANSANSTWRTLSAQELENMNLKTLDDLWEHQLTIRPGHRFDLKSFNEVGVNNYGAYQIDRVSYSSWYVPYVNGGTPNAQTFRRNGFELAGMYGYSNGLTRYLSGQTKTGDLEFYKTMTGNENFSFEAYRKDKNVEIQNKIATQKAQGNAYFDEEALIAYFKQNLINYGIDINAGASNGNVTLQNIKGSRENVFRYLQRITNEFRTPVYGEASTRNVVTISSGAELVQKLKENANGFYVLANDISMKDVQPSSDVYVNATFIGKIQGNGYKITDAQVPLLSKISNSYVSDLTVLDTDGNEKDWVAKNKQYTILVNEDKEETVKEITSVEELRQLGTNQYSKYILTKDLDVSSVKDTAIIKGTFKGIFDGQGYSITGLKAPLFEMVSEGTVRNVKIKDVNITGNESNQGAVTKKSNRSTFEKLELEQIVIQGESNNAVVTGYDYTSSIFSEIQIRNAEITGNKYYNAVFAGRASGSQISNVAVLESKVVISGTDSGGFIGSGKNITVDHVFSDADVVMKNYTDSENRTRSAGFIGNLEGNNRLEYVFAAGIVDNQTEYKFYNFLGTPDVIEQSVFHSFVSANAGGESNIKEGLTECLTEVSAETQRTLEFYQTQMNLDENIWMLNLVGLRGYPEIRGMDKKEVVKIETAEEFMLINQYPDQEYLLEADIDLTEMEQTESVIATFSGILKGNNHVIRGLKVPLFGELKGTVSDLALDQSEVAINTIASGGVFANTMKNAVVNKVMLHNVALHNMGGSGAAFAGTMDETQLTDIFVSGRAEASETVSGFVVTANDSTGTNIYTNVRINGTQGAGFLVNGTGESTYKNVLSVGNVEENMPKLMEDTSILSNAHEFAAADGISSAKEADEVKEIGKEIWSKDFYTTVLGFDEESWNINQVEKIGYAVLNGFEISLSPMEIAVDSPQDIEKLNRVPEGRFALTADVDFTGFGGNLVTKTFTGTLNGAGYTIKGISGPMFQKLSGTVKNLNFQNIFVENTDAGANVLAKETNKANVKNIFFNGITLKGGSYTGVIGIEQGSVFSQIGIQNMHMTANSDYAGALAAKASESNITDVVIAETKIMTEGEFVGGFIGSVEHAAIQNVFADAEIHMPYTKSPRNTAAFIGATVGEQSNITNCTAAGGVYPEDKSINRYKLLYMKDSQDLSELDSFTRCFVNTDTPGFASIGAQDPIGVTQAEMLSGDFYQSKMQLNAEVWDWSKVASEGFPRLKDMPAESIRPPHTEGTQEEEIPLQSIAPEGYTEIRTPEELLAIRGSSGKFILMNSISLYGYRPENSSFLGDFSGELDGNGLTIREYSGAPLFATFGGTVKNLKIADVKVETWTLNAPSNAFAMALSGATVNKMAFYNILLAGGRFTGTLAGTAENSQVSEVWAEGLNINPYGPVFKENTGYVGGLVAHIKSGTVIEDCYVGGEMVADWDFQGGVFGGNEFVAEAKARNIISNMRMKSSVEGNTKRSGFVGVLTYVYSPWLSNSLSIGEAGTDAAAGSTQPSYRFTGTTTGSGLTSGVENCYEGNQSGMSSAYEGIIKEVTKEQYGVRGFYENTLGFDSDKWNLATVEEKGYPSMVWMVGKEPEEQLPSLPQGSEVTEHPLNITNPSGYIEIRTPEQFMKIADNPSGKYILMNNISLEQVHLKGATSYIMPIFTGELHGNNQVIHGLRASLFDEVQGNIHDLRIQNVFVDAELKKDGMTRAEANGLARMVYNGTIERIYMNHVRLNGGSYTAALAGTLDGKSLVNAAHLEGLSINESIEGTEKYISVGGAIGYIGNYNSSFKNSYVQGNIVINNMSQGGVVGSLYNGLIRYVVGNMICRSVSGPNDFQSGFVGKTAGSSWKVEWSISIGNAGNNFKFIGSDITTASNYRIYKCYELSTATGVSKVTDATIANNRLLATDNIFNSDLYENLMDFKKDGAWDYGSVAERGYPTLKWLLTSDGIPLTQTEKTSK